MATAEQLINELRSNRAETLGRFTELPPERLTEPFPWRGAAFEMRFGLGWLAEGDDNARTAIVDTLARLGSPISVAQQAMVLAGEARGRLLGLLIGLSEPLFDTPPAEGEWSVRQILGHVIANDRRYSIAVRYALERARSGGIGPLRPPASSLPSGTDPAGMVGSMHDVIERVTTTGDAVAKELSAVPDALLDAPTNWVQWDLDVRFRLHRFAAHHREHANQVRKGLAALGFQQTEPQLLLADAAAARTALESLLLGIPDELVDAAPPDGRPTIRAILAARVDDEQRLDSG